MATKRRVEEMLKDTSARDYAVCDQCRIKKIRCGREKPFCANCTRLGQKCEWSGNGKKCNQTALLSHNYEGLSRRVDMLEVSLADINVYLADTVKRLVTENAISPTALEPTHTWPTPEETTFASHETPVYKRPIGHFLRSHDVQGSERYFTPTSLESLMCHLRDTSLEPLINGGSENQGVKERALLAQQKFDDLVSRKEETIRNGAIPTAPPISILRGMMEPFFANVNPYFPIWTKGSFERIPSALEEASLGEQDLAMVVCSNNLILMTLTANTAFLHNKPNKPRLAQNGSSIDLDLINGFLANAKRAIEHAELLLLPRLINVQALLSLCLVAQEYLSLNVFARLFNLAAQCANSIGIHDWDIYAIGLEGDEGARERQHISYCLYVLDKVVCSTAGASPYVPASDVHIEPITKSIADKISGDLMAKAKLAEIQEMIHLVIYSRQAPSRTADQVGNLISNFDQKLQDWLLSSGLDIMDAKKDTLNIKLSIEFNCTKLLYMRPFKEHPDIASRIIEVARRSMKLLMRLWRSSAKLEHQGAFPRVIASHPPLYIFEIFEHVLSGEGHDSDVMLLQSFVEMLHSVAGIRGKESYYYRLYEVSAAIMDVVIAMGQHKRRKLHLTSSSPTSSSSASLPPMEPQRSCPYSPYSDILPNNNEYTTSPPTEGGIQDTATLATSSFESSMSLTNSGGSSVGKSPYEPFDFLEYSMPQISTGENLIENEPWWDDKQMS